MGKGPTPQGTMGARPPTQDLIKAATHHIDSIEAAVADWFAVGLYTGIRKSEWAQRNNSDWRPDDFHREDQYSRLPRAFLCEDITFFPRRKAPLATSKLLAMSDNGAMLAIGQLAIQWRTQKNGHRNQQIRFTPNTKSPDLCCIQRMLSIFRCHHRLAGSTANCPPVRLYRPPNDSVHNIVTKDIETIMRGTIARWANLDPSNAAHGKLLSDWVSRSL